MTWKHIGSTLSRLDDCCMVIDNADNEETLSIGEFEMVECISVSETITDALHTIKVMQAA